MGGLSLGSFVARAYVDRIKNTLIWYGVLEILIGVFAYGFVGFLDLFSNLYGHVYQTYFESHTWVYMFVRCTIATLVLLPPTTLMGATLPLIVRRFVVTDSNLGRYVGHLYSINTLGALGGVFTVGFILLPNLGFTTTTVIAVSITITVGICALVLAFSAPPHIKHTDDIRESEKTPLIPAQGYLSRQQIVVLVAIFASGLGAMALEVIWMRIMTLIFSATAYAFSIMLCVFLFGIFLGSKVISRNLDSMPDHAKTFSLLEIWAALGIAVLGLVIYFVPDIFNRILWTLNDLSGNFGVAFVIVQFLIAALLILIPATLLGATFPVAVKMYSVASQVGRGTGAVYAANTAGGILGALMGGFFLMPFVGSRVSLILVSLIFFTTGTLLLIQAREGGSLLRMSNYRFSLLAIIVLNILVVFLPAKTVLNFESSDQIDEVLYRSEGVSLTVDIFRGDQGTVSLAIGGNMEASTHEWHRRHFMMKAYVPLLLHPNPKEVLIIGLGLGVTLSAIERFPGLERIQVVELNPDMLKAHQTEALREITNNVLDSDKVNVRIDDGRNFLEMSNQKFDMITADPMHPKLTGVGYLYTREYYESIKRLLKDNGTVCQWMPIFQMSPKSFDVAFLTFAEVFPNASFWYVKGNAMFAATKNEMALDYESLQKYFQIPHVASDLKSIGINNIESFVAHMLMGPREVRRYSDSIKSRIVNTDDNAYLEYHTPFELLYGADKTMENILPFSTIDRSLMTSFPEASKIEIERVAQEYRATILPGLVGGRQMM